MKRKEIMNKLAFLQADFEEMDSIVVMKEDAELIEETRKLLIKEQAFRDNVWIAGAIILLIVTLIWCYC